MKVIKEFIVLEEFMPECRVALNPIPSFTVVSSVQLIEIRKIAVAVYRFDNKSEDGEYIYRFAGVEII